MESNQRFNMKTAGADTTVRHAWWAASAGLVLALGGSWAHGAQDFPYSADFNDEATMNEFVFNQQSPWSISDGALNLVVEREAGDNDTFRADAEVDLPAETDFQFVSDLRLNSFDSEEGGTRLGLRFLGETALSDSGGGGGGYSVEFQDNGNMRLLKWYDGSFVAELDSTNLGTGLQEQTTYNFTIEVAYRETGGVDIDWTVDDGQFSETLSHFDASDIPAGGYFGTRHREFGEHLDLSMESFQVIPEPGTVALVGLGSLLMLRRGRRN